MFFSCCVLDCDGEDEVEFKNRDVDIVGYRVMFIEKVFLGFFFYGWLVFLLLSFFVGLFFDFC